MSKSIWGIFLVMTLLTMALGTFGVGYNGDFFFLFKLIFGAFQQLIDWIRGLFQQIFEFFAGIKEWFQSVGDWFQGIGTWLAGG